MAEVEQQCMEIKLNVPWGHVAAKTYGPSTGEPVLLVHGRLDNAGSFSRLMKYLPVGLFYYVCVDLPGHGWSSHFPPWLKLDVVEYAHALYFILKALQWKTCIYIGHSMGAQIGLFFSVLQPQRLKKIIALEALLMTTDTDSTVSIEKFFKNSFELSIIASSNVKPLFYTKEEILYAFQNMRIAALNVEAANALFERAVTEVNGKYKYNRDIRLKIQLSSLMSMEQYNQFNRRLSVPIYLFTTSHGLLAGNRNNFTSALESLNPKILHVFEVDGNHDVHNNNPERVAPFVCEILNSEFKSSKF